MHFVDNINFVFGLRWCITRLVTNITVSSTPLLLAASISMTSPIVPFRDSFTDVTFVTRLTVCLIWTVNGLLQTPSRHSVFPVPRGPVNK